MPLKKIVLTLILVFTLGYSNAQVFVSGVLQGQLGSQMFTIAAVYALALDNDAIPAFPDLLKPDSLPLFSHINGFLPPDKRQDNNRKFHIEGHSLGYFPIAFQPNMVLNGQYQSEKYFIHHKKEILDLFAPSTEYLDHLSAHYQDILDDPRTVAIHVRPFDHDVRKKYHKEIDRSYYEKAIRYFPAHSQFIVFSNNMTKAKKMLRGLPGSFRFIEGNDSPHDFYLMSLCKHQIIANSSFSWWAAYLNPNPAKVVISPTWFKKGPGMFSKDLIPSTWIMLK